MQCGWRDLVRDCVLRRVCVWGVKHAISVCLYLGDFIITMAYVTNYVTYHN